MKLKVILAFVGAGMLTFAFSTVSFAGPPCTDTDGDTICDTDDNCTLISNAGQRDDDLDGYGNLCDTDLDQDCISGTLDAGQISGTWLQGPPWNPNPVGNGTTGAFDIDQDNIIGTLDAGQISGNWLGPPGPSGHACAAWCNGTTQVGPPPAQCP